METVKATVKRATPAAVERVAPAFPVVGEYYVVLDPRRLEPDVVPDEDSDNLFDVGELIRVESIDDEAKPPTANVDGVHGGEVVIADLLASCQLEENPQHYVADRINAKMREIADFEPDPAKLGLSDAKLLTVAVSNDAASLVDEPATSLALTNDPIVVKRRLATAKNELAKFGKRLDSKRRELERLLDQQKGLLATRVAEMTAMIERFEAGVWTINLYLGKDEQVIRIKSGKPAPKDTPITIRQMTLYMDEESAAFAEKGGIDCDSIPEFDKWITSNKGHLQQVLPEPKGIVAIAPRRVSKHRRDDPWGARAKADTKTYFLMRNGEILYRVCVALEVGPNIIPFKDEMSDLFDKVTYDADGTRNTDSARPGTERWMAAMSVADATNQHYMRILLFLQGLLDRTVVFQPLPRPRLNVFNEAENGEMLRFVRDMEMTLPSNREPFRDWIARINGDLAVGHRIVATPHTFASKALTEWVDEKGKTHNARIRPPKATLPAEAIFTLEEREGDGFLFFFKRVVNKYVRYEGYREVELKQRGAYRVETSDTFFINFDRATVEEAKHYLSSRTDRHAYMTMVPLLHATIRLKVAEEKAEAPFKKLVIGKASEKYPDIEPEDVARRVDDLTLWWKLKNLWKRPIDDRAYTHVMLEFDKRVEMERRSRQGRNVYATVVAYFKKHDPDLLYVGHRPDGLYVTLSAHNRHNVFVKECTWRVRLTIKNPVVVAPSIVRARLDEEKSWRVVDGRRHSWFKLWVHPERWPSWQVDVRRSAHYSDNDVASFMSQVQKEMKDRGDHKTYKLVCVYNNRGGKLTAEFFIRPGYYPSKLILSTSEKEAKIQEMYAYETRRVKGGGVKYTVYKAGGDSPADILKRCDENDTLWHDETMLPILRREIERKRKHKAAWKRLREIATQADRALEHHLYELSEAKEKAEWLADFNDVELWEDEKKHRQIYGGSSGTFRRATDYLAERGFRLVGMTVGEILDKAFELGMSVTPPKKETSWHYSSDKDVKPEDLSKLPRDFCIPLDRDETDPFDEPAEPLEDADDDAASMDADDDDEPDLFSDED